MSNPEIPQDSDKQNLETTKETDPDEQYILSIEESEKDPKQITY
jgi:hypothetical protein